MIIFPESSRVYNNQIQMPHMDAYASGEEEGLSDTTGAVSRRCASRRKLGSDRSVIAGDREKAEAQRRKRFHTASQNIC